MIPLIAAGAWFLLAAQCIASRKTHPKRGLRGTEWRLLAGTLIVAIAFSWNAGVPAGWSGGVAPPVSRASAIPNTPRASCASLDTGMTRDEVLRRLGDPDEKRSDDETRGPGATALVYRATRCTVHLFDDRVEFVD